MSEYKSSFYRDEEKKYEYWERELKRFENHPFVKKVRHRELAPPPFKLFQDKIYKLDKAVRNVAFVIALIIGDTDVADILVNNEIDLEDIRDYAMVQAAGAGQLFSLEYIAKLGANPRAFGNECVIQVGPERDDNRGIVKKLSTLGALTKLTKAQRDPIISAVQSGQIQQLKRVVQSNEGNTHKNIGLALLLSAQQGNKDMIDYLFTLIDDPAPFFNQFPNPIDLAAEGGYIELVQHLHETYKAFVVSDLSSIKLAVRKGHVNVVKYLMQNWSSSMDVSLVDKLDSIVNEAIEFEQVSCLQLIQTDYDYFFKTVHLNEAVKLRSPAVFDYLIQKVFFRVPTENQDDLWSLSFSIFLKSNLSKIKHIIQTYQTISDYLNKDWSEMSDDVVVCRIQKTGRWDIAEFILENIHTSIHFKQNLLDAAFRGDSSLVVGQLLEEIVLTNDNFKNFLLLCARQNSFDCLKELVAASERHHLEAPAQTSQYVNECIYSLNVEMVRFLLSKDLVNFNIGPIKQILPLLAIRDTQFFVTHEEKSQTWDMIALVLENLDPHIPDSNVSFRILMIEGIKRNRYDIINVIGERFSAEIFTQDQGEVITEASKAGGKDVVSYLFFKGSDPTLDNFAAVRAAITHGNSKVVELFLTQLIANIPQLTINLFARLAIENSKLQVLRVLIKINSNILKNAHLVGFINTIEMMKFLVVENKILDKEQDANTRLEVSHFLLNKMVALGNIEMVNLLVDRFGANPTVNDYRAIRIAMAYGYLHLFIDLLETAHIQGYQVDEQFLTNANKYRQIRSELGLSVSDYVEHYNAFVRKYNGFIANKEFFGERKLPQEGQWTEEEKQRYGNVYESKLYKDVGSYL